MTPTEFCAVDKLTHMKNLTKKNILLGSPPREDPELKSREVHLSKKTRL